MLKQAIRKPLEPSGVRTNSLSDTLTVVGAAALSDSLQVGGSTTMSGTVTAGGDFKVITSGSDKFTVAASSGDTTVAGTLGVYTGNKFVQHTPGHSRHHFVVEYALSHGRCHREG